MELLYLWNGEELTWVQWESNHCKTWYLIVFISCFGYYFYACHLVPAKRKLNQTSETPHGIPWDLGSVGHGFILGLRLHASLDHVM